jgi:hypothetical protein
MLSEATSGLYVDAGRTRSSTFIYGLPPEVMLITAFVPCLIRGRKAAERLDGLVRPARFRIARVQMEDGCAASAAAIASRRSDRA